MCKRKAMIVALGGSLGMLMAGAVQAATFQYGYDSAAGLDTTSVNITNPVYSFDTTTKTEGSASLRMLGDNSNGPGSYNTFGYFVPAIDVTVNGSGQDLSQPNSSLTMDIRTDNTPDLSSGSYLDIYLYAGGTLQSPTDLAVRFYRSDFDDNTDGAFKSITLVITNAAGVTGGDNTGFVGGDTTLLNQVKFAQLQYHYGGTSSAATFDVHYDNLKLIGPGVTAVPEPASLALLGLGGLLLARRRRQS